MTELSPAGQRKIRDIAERHGFSPEAVASMLKSVAAGHGRMAQFDHPEFGGSGQWMHGGMTMISDMFNATLKARVERLCDELSTAVANEPNLVDDELSNVRHDERPSMAQHERWWPAHLGRADSTGSQNGMRYAFFAAARRLVIDIAGRISIYDTLDHRISGVSQQQSDRGSLTFSSQHGRVDITTLPDLSDAQTPAPNDAAPKPFRR